MPQIDPAAMLAADDVTRDRVWRGLSDQERDKLPQEVRDACIVSVKRRAPWVDETIGRLEREQALLPKNGTRFPRVWLDDTEPDLSVDDYIKAAFPNGFIVVVGPSGEGKTFFVSDAMLHVACTLPWRGRRVRQALVVWIAAEAGKGALRRFYAWREHNLASNRDHRVPFAIITRGVNLLQQVEVEALMLELQTISAEAGLPIGIVVFDTWSRSMPGGDENGAADTTQAIAVADRIRDELHAAVVAIHHTGKDPGKGARGHSSLFAAADTVITVADRVATIEKSRDGTSGEQFPFELKVVELGIDEDGDPITSCVVIHCPTTSKATTRQPKLSTDERIALDTLREEVSISGQHLPETSTIPRNTRGIQVEAWRNRFFSRLGESGDREQSSTAKKQAWYRGKKGLIAKHLVMAWEGWAWLI